MKTTILQVPTHTHTAMIDITREIEDLVRQSGISEGLCLVFIPHTTAAVTINEDADPDVQRDFMKEMETIVPWTDSYSHSEGNSAAHIKASMMGFSEEIIIENGRLLLGTWQGIYFMEYDGPRQRKAYVKIYSTT